MHNDKITLKDLSILGSESDENVFSLINRTVSHAGREVLIKHIQHPPDSYELLLQTQATIKFMAANTELWPAIISNGTIVMLEKFFESSDIESPSWGLSLILGSFFQKILNKTQYFHIQFSLSHLSDFLNGCQELVRLSEVADVPVMLQATLDAMRQDLNNALTEELTSINRQTSYPVLKRLSYEARRDLKGATYRLIKHYAKLDAWRSMATATTENKWTFPQLEPSSSVVFDAQGLFHPLLERPISYNITLNGKSNFLLLTGANMSGKTTFMRSIGVAALMAHLGMGVPAKKLTINFMQGIITNMQVEDNLIKGESYFFAEVQRMKLTAQKLLQHDAHLVLMDELFKGTNVHDAYECTRAVIEGLLDRPGQIMVLSTHLYEVAHNFVERDDILFKCFITKLLEDGSYSFLYELQDGISDDRIGYRILQKEGVINLLQSK